MGTPQSRAVWSLLEPLVWLESGYPSCQKLRMPAGAGDRETGVRAWLGAVVMGTERGSLQLPGVQPLGSGASLLALDMVHLHRLSPCYGGLWGGPLATISGPLDSGVGHWPWSATRPMKPVPPLYR